VRLHRESVATDASCRPHEILKLKIKDIVFKQVDGKSYAEILVNGKRGSRHIPLIHSIPYVKEWLDAHPIKNNPRAPFICAVSKGLGHRVTTDNLNKTLHSYKTEYFPKLLNNPEVPQEEKNTIIVLLSKPWNPYIFQTFSMFLQYIHVPFMPCSLAFFNSSSSVSPYIVWVHTGSTASLQFIDKVMIHYLYKLICNSTFCSVR
jgi:hypothetical protein